MTRCILGSATSGTKGYPQRRDGNRNVRFHREAMERRLGRRLAPTEHVLHTCHNQAPGWSNSRRPHHHRTLAAARGDACYSSTLVGLPEEPPWLISSSCRSTRRQPHRGDPPRIPRRARTRAVQEGQAGQDVRPGAQSRSAAPRRPRRTYPRFRRGVRWWAVRCATGTVAGTSSMVAACIRRPRDPAAGGGVDPIPDRFGCPPSRRRTSQGAGALVDAVDLSRRQHNTCTTSDPRCP